MSTIILHHYDVSPYSEKLRALFGYTNMAWQSSITEEMPPRRKLKPLAGNYGRIPVAQIGADIFCDSNLICSELSRITAKPELALEGCSADVNDFVRRVEGDIFFACVMAGSTNKLHRRILKSVGIKGFARLLIDRLNMSRKAKIKMVSMLDANKIALRFLEELEGRLVNDFLFGSQPNIADFSAYHCIWFMRDLGGRNVVKNYPRTLIWLDTIKAMGEGERDEINPQQALDIAKHETPREITVEDAQSDYLGKAVSIAPNDYRLDATVGILVGESDQRWIIARENSDVDRVHVHFPKAGFELTLV